MHGAWLLPVSQRCYPAVGLPRTGTDYRVRVAAVNGIGTGPYGIHANCEQHEKGLEEQQEEGPSGASGAAGDRHGHVVLPSACMVVSTAPRLAALVRRCLRAVSKATLPRRALPIAGGKVIAVGRTRPGGGVAPLARPPLRAMNFASSDSRPGPATAAPAKKRPVGAASALAGSRPWPFVAAALRASPDPGTAGAKALKRAESALRRGLGAWVDELTAAVAGREGAAQAGGSSGGATAWGCLRVEDVAAFLLPCLEAAMVRGGVPAQTALDDDMAAPAARARAPRAGSAIAAARAAAASATEVGLASDGVSGASGFAGPPQPLALQATTTLATTTTLTTMLPGVLPTARPPHAKRSPALFHPATGGAAALVVEVAEQLLALEAAVRSWLGARSSSSSSSSSGGGGSNDDNGGGGGCGRGSGGGGGGDQGAAARRAAVAAWCAAEGFWLATCRAELGCRAAGAEGGQAGRGRGAAGGGSLAPLSKPGRPGPRPRSAPGRAPLPGRVRGAPGGSAAGSVAPSSGDGAPFIAPLAPRDDNPIFALLFFRPADGTDASANAAPPATYDDDAGPNDLSPSGQSSSGLAGGLADGLADGLSVTRDGDEEAHDLDAELDASLGLDGGLDIPPGLGGDNGCGNGCGNHGLRNGDSDGGGLGGVSVGVGVGSSSFEHEGGDEVNNLGLAAALDFSYAVSELALAALGAGIEGGGAAERAAAVGGDRGDLIAADASADASEAAAIFAAAVASTSMLTDGGARLSDGEEAGGAGDDMLVAMAELTAEVEEASRLLGLH